MVFITYLFCQLFPLYHEFICEKSDELRSSDVIGIGRRFDV